MILKIHKRNATKWWIRMYNVYKITTGAVVSIDGEFYNIETFEGKLSIVRTKEGVKKLAIRKVRKYRYAALEKRKTICNHLNLAKRYRFDITDKNCEYCYITSRCSMVHSGWRKRTQLAVKDLMLVSQYFEENSNG